VLRAEAGQRYEISDNRHVYLAEIEMARKERVVFRALEKLEAHPPLPLVLCAALVKFDHFEWMIEKATELGVAEIVPVASSRSERGLERAAHKRVERWRRIALEASQQSRRAILPVVHEPTAFAEALAIPAAHRYALDEAPSGARFADGLRGTVAILVGPEGGWTDSERESFVAAGWAPVSLGPFILRAETAAIAALAIAAAKLAA
jgi:16S rRNA (uracil1498-N3)-methyltransferase